MTARDVIAVRGPDAAAYLQGQLSQDVLALAVGDSALSLLLQPQGKVDAWLRLTRIADDEFVLDVDAGWGERVVARLKRFLLRVKVDIEPLGGWGVAVFAGDAAVPPGAWRAESEVPFTTTVVGPGVAGGIDDERLRIANGIPRMGRELDESTIPAAAGIVDRSVSFTKGCYTGQELVARIDSRGDRTPSKLRRITGVAAPGSPVVVDGRQVGVITSAEDGVALAYIRREVEPPVEAEVDGARVTIEP